MNIFSFKTKIKNKIWYFIKDYFFYQRVVDSPLILNINKNCNVDQKKVLICYLSNGYFLNIEKVNGRTIPFEIFKIINVFSALDYCIDLIGCNDTASLEFVKSTRYNLIFGFGETFYQSVKRFPNSISILYMTENHPDFSYIEETKRINYFYTRHGKKTKITRSGIYYKRKHMEIKYSHVITLSETEPLEIQYTKPFTIFPTGIINPDYIFRIKDHQFTKYNFLWLGSTGAIHKGLDLLIDVFSNRNDIILHICGLSDIDRKILNLKHRVNIIEYGHIDIKSKLFLQIVETCSFIILPSCSEGFSTSITTGMLHGLIPIIMENTGFNRLFENAIFLNNYKIEYLDSKLTEIASKDPADLRLFSKRVYEFAHQNFIINIFEENFRKIILDVVGKENIN
jgi:hypothetical protein